MTLGVEERKYNLIDGVILYVPIANSAGNNTFKCEPDPEEPGAYVARRDPRVDVMGQLAAAMQEFLGLKNPPKLTAQDKRLIVDTGGADVKLPPQVIAGDIVGNRYYVQRPGIKGLKDRIQHLFPRTYSWDSHAPQNKIA